MIFEHEEKNFETSLKTESAEFGIDDMDMIIDILQNRLYSNKKQTLVQEYMSNGRDATREVLGSRPIEVTVPSALHLFFDVRDFGPGISRERMYKVFIKYGGSTKRKTNSQTGGFGIGAKSAFSYTNSFQITTYIDGVKTVYLAHITKSKKGNLDIISEGETTEPNGTKISIPIQKEDVNDFINAAQRACFFWEESERPVFKNYGSILYHDWKYQQGALTVSDYGGSARRLMASIDGILYPMDNLENKINKEQENLVSRLAKMFTSNNTLVLKMPNGFVKVAASRERIEDEDETFENLIPLLKDTFAKVQADYESKKTFSNFEECLGAIKEVSSMYSLTNFKAGNWSLEKSGSEWVIHSPLLDKVSFQIVEVSAKGTYRPVKLGHKQRYNSSAADTFKYLYVSEMAQGKIYFVDYSSDAAVIINRKIKQDMQKNKITKAKVIDFRSMPLSDETKAEIISTLKGKKVSELVYEKPEVIKNRGPRAVRGSQIDNSKISLYTWTGTSHRSISNYTSEELTKFEKIVYVPYDLMMNDKYRQAFSLSQSYPNYLFVGVTKSSFPKFKVLPNVVYFGLWFPTLKASKDNIEGYINSQIRNQTYIEKLLPLPGVTSECIQDLKNFYSLYQGKTYPSNLPEVILRQVKEHPDTINALQTYQEKVTIIKEKYPLLSAINLGSLDLKQKADLIKFLNLK